MAPFPPRWIRATCAAFAFMALHWAASAQDPPADKKPAAGERFRDRGEYVEDTQTGLLWQKDGEASGKKNFYQAAEYAAKCDEHAPTTWAEAGMDAPAHGRGRG